MKWWANAFVIRTPEGEEVNKGTKTKFERKMTENISKLTKKKKKIKLQLHSKQNEYNENHTQAHLNKIAKPRWAT